MAEVAFYHLQTIGLETALPQLLGKCLARGWNAVVEVGAADRIEALDTHLWTFSDESFMPHAAEGGQGSGQADRQPVWLTAGDDNPNGASVRFYVEGALPEAFDGLSAYERAILMFNGQDEKAVQAAREAWKALLNTDHTLSYWKQSDEGAWVKARQHPPGA